jgi:hypothetical protein
MVGTLHFAVWNNGVLRVEHFYLMVWNSVSEQIGGGRQNLWNTKEWRLEGRYALRLVWHGLPTRGWTRRGIFNNGEITGVGRSWWQSKVEEYRSVVQTRRRRPVPCSP